MQQKSLVSQVETYTYIDEEDGNPMEVLLVGVQSDSIGTNNTFEPPGFHREHITTWLRQRYFFLDGVVFSQIPRQFQNYPDIVLDQFECGPAFATEVTEEDNQINVYYTISDSEAVCLSWDTTIDHWSMSIVSQPSSDGNIMSDRGHASDSTVIWRAP